MRHALLAFLAVSSSPLAAQGIAANVAGQLGSPTRMQYSLGWIAPRWTLFEATLGGTWIHANDGDRFGGQLDLAIAQGEARRWYGVASIAGGPSSGDAESPWGGWSAGMGWRLLRVGSTELSVEGRYLHLWRPDDAFVLGGRIATRWGRKASPPPVVPSAPVPAAAPPNPPLSTVAPAAGSSAAQSAVASAIAAMGTPYVWGGTAANGFDCSGLIQYAYAQAGISLPRRSIDQARAGSLVPTSVAGLEPGDILAFSRDPGGPVSHVGLYVGERRFIHSSSTGVRLSVLSETEPDGKHWMARWIGARRIANP